MPRSLVWTAGYLTLIAAFALPQWGFWRSSRLDLSAALRGAVGLSAALRGAVQAQEAQHLFEPAPAAVSGGSYRAGGTLHDVRVAEWIAASEHNQLATAADWALAFPSVRLALTTNRERDGLLRYARAMRSCVSQAAADEDARPSAPRTSDIAAACAVLLNWVSPET